MVLQVTIYRVVDGLPLTGTTDIDQRPEVKYCQKYLKLMSRRLGALPDRCVLHLDGFNVYLISTKSLSFMALCEDSYPMVLAYCFLDEIHKEFLVAYPSQTINMVKRPYGLIEFELYLKKTKHRYLNTRQLTTKLDLSDMSTELRLRPPYIVQGEELGLIDNSIFVPRKDTLRPTVTPGRRLMPVTWIGMMSIFLNLFCMALNLTRGMTIIGHGHYDEDDNGAYEFGAAFLIAGLASVYQVYLIFYFCRWRKLKTLFSLSVICGCCYFVQQFRNNVQISFHIGVAVFSSLVIFQRRLSEKLPGYSV